MAEKKIKFHLKSDPEHEMSIVWKHAENLLTLQEKGNRDDWILSDGQNLTFKNGTLTKTGPSIKSGSGSGKDTE